jgi:predicted permease
MKQGARTATGGRERFHPQRVLTVAQISFSLVLIVGALLFVRSFQKLMVLDPGFRTNGILVARLMFRPDVVPQKRRMAAYDAILKNLRAIPGVDSAAAVNNPPLMGGFGGDRIHIDGDNVESHYTNDNRVGEDYFATMGIPLLAGRGFNIHDSNSSAPVAIVDDTFAAQFLGGSDPIGRTFYSLPAPGQPIKRYQIVGLVGRSKYPGLVKGFDPIVYLSIRQQTDHWAGMNFEIHSNLPLAATMKAVQRAIMSVNSQFNIDLRSFPTEIHRSMRNESLIAQLSSFFGLLALILATVGLYGVMSFIVTHRRNEIGIRLAIGASRRAILGMILKQATVVLIAGLAAGVVFSLLLSRWAQSLLFDVKANDPYLIAAAALLLAVITIAATLIPARKAANLDPMQTLRNE